MRFILQNLAMEVKIYSFYQLLRLLDLSGCMAQNETLNGAILFVNLKLMAGARSIHNLLVLNMVQIKYVIMKSPQCALDISDGSERGEYVPQKYLFKAIGRPSRSVNIMYEYHPNDKNWPEMGTLINKKYRRKRVTNGYFPYMAIYKGNTDCNPFNSMRDIRKYGQDVQLTMTFDFNIPETDLIKIAKDLRSFGQIIFRINHECNGHWFTFNKKNTYTEVGKFFVRFHHILHEYAPNVKTNACFNGISKFNKLGSHMGEDELGPAFRIADVVSFDFYHSLHWGWPDDGYDPVKDGIHAKIKKVKEAYKISHEEWWEILYNFHNLMLEINEGEEKDIYIGEANTDADVVGLQAQAQWVYDFYNQVKKRNHSWLKGITFYQFRDRGGLGLEYEDKSNPTKGKPNPALAAYRDIAQDPYFNPCFEISPVKVKSQLLELEWKSSEDAKGIYIEDKIPPLTKAVLLKFDSGSNVIIKAGKKWFYKSPFVNTIDISSSLDKESKLKIYIFAPPPSGENLPAADCLDVYRCKMSIPQILFNTR